MHVFGFASYLFSSSVNVSSIILFDELAHGLLGIRDESVYPTVLMQHVKCVSICMRGVMPVTVLGCLQLRWEPLTPLLTCMEMSGGHGHEEIYHGFDSGCQHLDPAIEFLKKGVWKRKFNLHYLHWSIFLKSFQFTTVATVLCTLYNIIQYSFSFWTKKTSNLNLKEVF